MIRTEILKPVPGKPGQYSYEGQRKYGEVFDELYEFLKNQNLLPDEYFIFHSLLNREDEFPDCNFQCFAQWGGGEGIYLSVILVFCENGNPKHTLFATGKTLSETEEAYDRMQYIAGCIYKEFCGDYQLPCRYMLFPADTVQSITHERLIAKLEHECSDFMRTELLHKQADIAECSRKLGQMLTILSVIKDISFYEGLSSDKIDDLYNTEHVLEHIYAACGSIYNADSYEIADMITAAPSLQALFCNAEKEGQNECV